VYRPKMPASMPQRAIS